MLKRIKKLRIWIVLTVKRWVGKVWKWVTSLTQFSRPVFEGSEIQDGQRSNSSLRREGMEKLDHGKDDDGDEYTLTLPCLKVFILPHSMKQCHYKRQCHTESTEYLLLIYTAFSTTKTLLSYTRTLVKNPLGLIFVSCGM